MPLIKSKSKKALQENIETEMKAHPEKKKQDLAIAYSVQRQARKKKFANGGSTSSDSDQGPGNLVKNIDPSLRSQVAASFGGDRSPASAPSPGPKKYAQGGEVEEHYDSIADAILAKKRAADSIDRNEEEEPANDWGEFDDKALEEDSDSTMDGISDYSDDSGSIADRIRSKLRMQKRMK